MESWVCTSGGKSLLVQCEGVLTAFEVKQYAARRLRVDPATVEMRLFDQASTVSVRWTGDDYTHGGQVGMRRLQERTFRDSDWVDA